MGGLLNLFSMPLDGLLKRNIAGFCNPGLINVDIICNIDIFIKISLIALFSGSLDKCMHASAHLLP